MDPDHASPGQVRLKITLIVINVILLVTGVILSVLGLELDLYLKRNALYSNQPLLWWVGVLPCACGIFGTPVVALQKKYLIIAWVVIVTLLGGSGYTVLSLTGCLEPEQYGVNVQIFGHCIEEDWRCACLWQDGRRTMLEFSTCSDIYHLTSIYISLIVVLIVCLSCGATGAMLGCVAAHCIPGRTHQEQQHKKKVISIEGAAEPTFVKKSASTPSMLPSPITEECEEDLEEEEEKPGRDNG